jgi:hypothetical protein
MAVVDPSHLLSFKSATSFLSDGAEETRKILVENG